MPRGRRNPSAKICLHFKLIITYLKNDGNDASKQNNEKHLVAIFRSRLKIDRPVARIEVGHRGDQAGSDMFQEVGLHDSSRII